MADATYNTPISQPSITGIQVNTFQIARTGPTAFITFDNLDSNGNVTDTFTINITSVDPSPTAVKDFATALITSVAGEPANSLLKLNYRIIRHAISRGYITGATAV